MVGRAVVRIVDFAVLPGALAGATKTLENCEAQEGSRTQRGVWILQIDKGAAASVVGPSEPNDLPTQSVTALVPVGWSRHPQRRRRRRFAAARCGVGAYRRRLPLIVLNLDNDDLGPQRGSPSGGVATDHSRRPDRAGRRLATWVTFPLVGRDYESAVIFREPSAALR
jgi:hypothetical protein